MLLPPAASRGDQMCSYSSHIQIQTFKHCATVRPTVCTVLYFIFFLNGFNYSYLFWLF